MYKFRTKTYNIAYKAIFANIIADTLTRYPDHIGRLLKLVHFSDQEGNYQFQCGSFSTPMREKFDCTV